MSKCKYCKSNNINWTFARLKRCNDCKAYQPFEGIEFESASYVSNSTKHKQCFCIGPQNGNKHCPCELERRKALKRELNKD